MGVFCSKTDDDDTDGTKYESQALNKMPNKEKHIEPTERLLKDNDTKLDEAFSKILLKEYSLYKSILDTFNLSGGAPMFKDMTINIDTMIRKYQHFMLSIKENYNKFEWKPLDPSIQFMWRIHLLHPLKYINDCNKHFGEILFPPNYIISDFPNNIKYNVPSNYDENKVFTEMDLKKSAKKQFNFIFDVESDERLWVEHIKPDERRIYHVIRYKQFLKTSGYLLPKTISPTRMIDFIWHTHMVHFANYYMECGQFTRGKVLGHNDMEDGVDSFDDDPRRINLWQNKYDNVAIKDLDVDDNVCFSWDFRLYQEAMRLETEIFMIGYIKYCAETFGIIIPMELQDLLCKLYFVPPEEDKIPDTSGPAYCSVLEFFHRIE